MNDIDPFQFGVLTAQVTKLQSELDDVRKDVKALLAMADRSKGGLWVGMAVASSMGAVAGYVVSHLKGLWQ